MIPWMDEWCGVRFWGGGRDESLSVGRWSGLLRARMDGGEPATMTATHPQGITTIDCQFHEPQRAAVYLLTERGHGAFVDQNVGSATPLLMGALEARGMRGEDVDLLIVTHVHLDHAGGSGAMARLCPNATVVCHPRAAQHLADPAKLCAAVRALYGDEDYDRLFGEVVPINEARLRAVEDGETIEWQGRRLEFMHVRGHANHHIAVHEPGREAVYSGDAFGIGRVGPGRVEDPLVMAACAPADFDPEEARRSAERIVGTGAKTVYQTHFGAVTALEKAHAQLLESIGRMEKVMREALEQELNDEILEAFCLAEVEHEMHEQIDGSGRDDADALKEWFRFDVRLNALGVVAAVQKVRRRAQSA